MIHQNLIKRRADEDGLSAPTVERDYVLAHSLAAISDHDREGRLVFKGGTALRLCHFEDYRYSADLDFSAPDLGLVQAVVVGHESASLQLTCQGALTGLAGTEDRADATASQDIADLGLDVAGNQLRSREG